MFTETIIMTTASDPAWLTAARASLGLRETPGPGNAPGVMAMARRVGLKWAGMLYNADAVPWCGLAMADWMLAAGIDPPRIAVRALSWATWGANLRPTHLAPGAVLVFGRAGGGHVALYLGEDALSYHVLGGNQSDAVTVTRIAKSRLVASRWPRGVPVLGGPVMMAAAGGPVSSNEA